MLSSWSCWALLTAALTFFISIQSGQAIYCWDCNSAYDPACDDRFNNHSIALVNCDQLSYPHLEVKVATFCRKTVQRVNGKKRIIRGCGWLNSSHEDYGHSCFQRAGSHDIYVTHCTCFADGCNTAANFPIMISSIVGAMMVLIPLLMSGVHL